MIDQPANSQDSGRLGWQTPPQTANTVSIGTTEIRSIAKRLCPACGEPVDSHTAPCPACGEDLAALAPKQIRCMHCHSHASSELVVCPGCGRELREAAPKLMTLGVPALLALLLVALVVSQWERVSPITWARSNLVRGVVLVEDLSASIEPEMVIVMTPIVEGDLAGNAEGVPADAVAGGDSASSAVALLPADRVVVDEAAGDPAAGELSAAQSVITPVPVQDDGQQDSATSVLAVGVTQEVSSGVGGPEPTATSVPSLDEPEPLVAAMAQQGDMVLPEATAELPTPGPTVETAAAQGIAAAFGANEPTRTATPTWTVPASDAAPPANVAGADAEMAQAAGIAAASTPLPTPTATPTLVTTPLPTPTVTPVVYQVRTGDTLVTIAARYEVEVEELMEANDIGAQDVFVLQPGAMLYIPVPTPVPSSGGEPLVSTASAATELRLEAPVLVVPSDEAVIGCATGGKLMWQRVQFVKDSDKYVLHLGFVNGETNNGQEDVVWILAQSGPVTQTEWQLDTSLCDLAPDQFGRQWRWWVEVVEEVDGRVVPVSPPSLTRSFVWE